MESKPPPDQAWPAAPLTVKGGGRPGSPANRGAGYWLGANLVTAALYCTLGYAVSLFFAKFGLFPAPI